MRNWQSTQRWFAAHAAGRAGTTYDTITREELIAWFIGFAEGTADMLERKVRQDELVNT
jgi:hypothetical protein